MTTTLAPSPFAPPAPAPLASAPQASLSGWGRYPVARMAVHRPERMDELVAAVRGGSSVLARGLGRSYGDAALNGGGAVILTGRLDRFLDFDPVTGVLSCEAGVTFEDVLRHFGPRGFFPPVLPGTKFVSLGGALAADVHGKNHHVAGSIGSHVLDFRLVTADGATLRCSREEHPDLFRATIGGMGLTGIITELRLRLRRSTSAWVRVDRERATHLDEALELFDTTDDRYDYSVAWIDCLARGRSLGRSVLMRGNRLEAAELPAAARRGRRRWSPLDGMGARGFALPVDLPGFLLNAATVQAFNAAYYRRHATRSACVHQEPFFFPLDRIRHWNRLYGARGFLQYQFALPLDGGREGLTRILERLAGSGVGSFLAVLKKFGATEPGAMLSFPIPGYTLALDMAYRPAVLPLLDELDAVVADHGGRVYLAKDARMGPGAFRRMYDAALTRWREVRERVDPAHRFASDLSRRLGLER